MVIVRSRASAVHSGDARGIPSRQPALNAGRHGRGREFLVVLPTKVRSKASWWSWRGRCRWSRPPHGRRSAGIETAAAFLRCPMSENGQQELQGSPDTVRKKRDFITALEAEATVLSAAKATGLSRSTLYHWRQQDEAFATLWDEAQERAFHVLESSLYRRAVDGDHTAAIYLHKVFKARARQPKAPSPGSGDSVVRPPATVKPVTLADIFRGAPYDLTMLEGWQKMAEVLSQYDVRYVMPTLIKVADQQMKITILKSRGVVDGLLAEMRQHMAEIFDVPS